MSRASPAAAFADDDPVGPHAQCIPHQVADGVLAGALDVGRLRLQRDDVVLVQLQLLRVLDGDDPLLVRDEAGQDVEHRRLAGARAAADQDVAAIDDAGPQEHGGRRGDRSQFDQVVHREPVRRKLADRQAGTAHGQRRDDGVHAGAVGKPGVDQRLALVDPSADLGDDALDDRLGHLVGDEPPAGKLDNAVSFDVDLVAVDHHDLGDRRRAEQILQRTEAEDRVLQVLLERPEHEVLPQLVVQMRPHQRKDVGETFLGLPDASREVRLFVQLQFLAGEVQQVLQFGFAFGDQRGRDVELVPGQAVCAEAFVVAFENQLVDDIVAERQADDLLQQRVVLFAEQPQLPADVFDVLLQQQDAFVVAELVVLQFVQVEAFEQLRWTLVSSSDISERRWASSSCRLMGAASSDSKVSV